MKHLKIFTILGAVATLMLLTNCVKEEFNIVPNVIDDSQKLDIEPNISIADLKARYAEGGIIDSAFVIEATIISSDESGNIYKTLHIQDSTGGLVVAVDQQEMFREYPIGQLLNIKCEGLFYSFDKSIPQLQIWSEAIQEPARIPESQMPKYVFKLPGGAVIQPKTKRISELTNADISTLIRLIGVQFAASDTTKTYAIDQPITSTNTGQDRVLEDFAESTIILRNSNYSSFKHDSIPSGRGDVVCIYTKYNDTKQLVIRDLNDVAITDNATERIVRNYLVNEDFAGNLGVFTPKSITGSQAWFYKLTGSTSYATMSGYQGGNQENEDWLISPAMDLRTVQNALFTFKHAINFHSHADWSDIQVLVSTTYDGSANPDITDGTWTELTGYERPAGNNWTFIPAGTLDLLPYVGNENVRIAFRYRSTTTAACTWELDYVKVIVEN